MIKRELINQIKWIILAFFISFVLVSCFENTVLNDSVVVKAPNTFLGLNLFLEILIFFVFSTFVVFGIKGFFEMYSQKTSNVIILVSGVLLLFVNFILCYQILFQE
jgi:ABC-type transport system involved in multi-copper enzyme maturation permease subunit